MAKEPENACDLDAAELLHELDDLQREASTFYERMVRPNASESFNQSLYGYVSRAFAFIDLLSTYWCTDAGASQTRRMVDFLQQYTGRERRAHAIAVQVWRHKLIHTARPRDLIDGHDGHAIRYLIHWHEERMTPHQPHYVILRLPDAEILGVACLSFLADVRGAAVRLVADIATSSELQRNVTRVAANLASDTLRRI